MLAMVIFFVLSISCQLHFSPDRIIWYKILTLTLVNIFVNVQDLDSFQCSPLVRCSETIHGPQKIKPANIDVTIRLIFLRFSEMSELLLGGLP